MMFHMIIKSIATEQLWFCNQLFKRSLFADYNKSKRKMELYHETRAFTRHLNFNQKFNNRSKAASDKVFDRTSYFWFKGTVKKVFFGMRM